ncbi:cytochrome c nitrite reductase small subunit [Thiococcus pfennigii]|uniref:cytochrome c nitrite reductase small subunit n=1 Tax=Thiococcus pfennigii TaxID=1057 RepID=UPI0019067B55|nr:cytochrome c nitrite reductase small subunit [Thiococcus pfennigii]MBK1699577.1 cytochrome c nitrite reductase small subunit [Thiococcus pfennigii]MBK1731752.1 cytochrome c nitrite reductase small subunit [Thiococcus pfennigii]
MKTRGGQDPFAGREPRPPRPRPGGWLAIALAAALGVLGGVGLFTLGYGNGLSYLTDDPTACINCHLMQDPFDAWVKSSHRGVAGCNDCHLPHDPVGKWLIKADNGFFHALAFTTGDFHEPLQIRPRNRRVTQAACLHCHRPFVDHMLPAEPGDQALLCVHCHSDVGHALRR